MSEVACDRDALIDRPHLKLAEPCISRKTPFHISVHLYAYSTGSTACLQYRLTVQTYFAQ
jgi:hypothetical protein